MIKISGICYIIGASKENAQMLKFEVFENDLVIAADGGYDSLNHNEIRCDILLGDFDSIKSVPDEKNIIRYPKDKDETDTFLAYRVGYEKGYRNFVIFGGVGGRFDHTVANLQTLSHIAKNGARGFLVGDGCITTVITDSQIDFSENSYGKAGVFAYGKNASGVTISGLKYTLSHTTLTPEFPLGVSNEFIGLPSRVSVERGSLIIVWYETFKEFSENFSFYRI